MACFFGTNDEQAKYMAKAEANAMERIRSVAKEAASKVEQMMVAKAMEQAKRKEFETIERNEYNEIMNAQEDADEAKYWEQPKREPMLSDDHMNIMFASYGIGFAQYGDKVRKWYEAKIASGELMVVKTAKKVDVPILISSAHGGTWSTAPGCSECGRRWKPGDPFCGCGAKIIE